MKIGKKDAFDETNDDWNAYVKRVEQYFIANEINEAKQVALMLSLMGNKTYRILQNLSAPAKQYDLSYCGNTTLIAREINSKENP